MLDAVLRCGRTLDAAAQSEKALKPADLLNRCRGGSGFVGDDEATEAVGSAPAFEQGW